MSETPTTHSTAALRQNSTNSTMSSNKVFENVRQSLDRSDDIIKQLKLTHEDSQHLFRYTKHLHNTLRSIEEETRKHTSLLTSNELEKMTEEHEQMNNDIAEMKTQISQSEENQAELKQHNVQVNTEQEKKEHGAIEKPNVNVDNSKMDNNQSVTSSNKHDSDTLTATPLKNVKDTTNYMKAVSASPIADIPKTKFVETVKHAPYENSTTNDAHNVVEQYSDERGSHESMYNNADLDSNGTASKHTISNGTHTESERLYDKPTADSRNNMNDSSESFSETLSDSSSSDTLEDIEPTENTISAYTQTNTPTKLRKHKMRGSSNLNTQTFIKNDKTGLTLVSLPINVQNERTRKMSFVRKIKSGNTVPVALKHGLFSDMVRQDRIAKLPAKTK